MNDTPTLDEALEEASSTLTEEVETETEEQPQEVQEETQEPEESQEEVFAEKPELEGKSPEELEEIYQNWQKAYTQKRQAEKEEVKSMQKKLREIEAKQAQEPEIPIEQMTPEQLQQHFTKKAQAIATVARENSYIEAQEKSFYELDERLNEDNPKHDPNLFYAVVGQVTQERDKFEQENGTVVGFDFVGEAKAKIQAYDELVKQQVQNYLSKQNKAVQSKSDRFRKSNPKTKAGEVKKAGGMDLEDAFSEALSETGGGFEY